jgi:GT2 family glycosyltransferase
VTIIIVAYNSGHYLDECLQSIAAARHERVCVEVVIVDNHSSDGTIDRLRGFEGLRLSIIENERNVGFAAAANRGIAATDGDYVLLLNPDTLLTPGVIDEMARFMDQHPEAGIVSPKLVMQDGRIDPACHRGFPTPWASATYFMGLERLFPRRRLFNGYHRWDLPLDQAHEVDAVSGAFLFARRRLLRAMGGLDERFFMYGEDIDACLRAREHGYKVYYTPAATVVHIKGTSTGIGQSAKVSCATGATRMRMVNTFHDSMVTFYDKHYAAKYPRPVGSAMKAGIGAHRWVAKKRLVRSMKNFTPAT